MYLHTQAPTFPSCPQTLHFCTSITSSVGTVPWESPCSTSAYTRTQLRASIVLLWDLSWEPAEHIGFQMGKVP